MILEDVLEMRDHLGEASTILEHCKEKVCLYTGPSEYADYFSSSISDIQDEIHSIRVSLLDQVK